MNKQSFKGFVYSYRAVQQCPNTSYYWHLCVLNLESGSLLVYDLRPYKQINKQLTYTNLRSRYSDADSFINRFHYFTLKIIIVWKKIFNFATKGNLFINFLVAKCISPNSPLNFHNFLFRKSKCMKRAFI